PRGLSHFTKSVQTAIILLTLNTSRYRVGGCASSLGEPPNHGGFLCPDSLEPSLPFCFFEQWNQRRIPLEGMTCEACQGIGKTHEGVMSLVDAPHLLHADLALAQGGSHVMPHPLLQTIDADRDAVGVSLAELGDCTSDGRENTGQIRCRLGKRGVE